MGLPGAVAVLLTLVTGVYFFYPNLSIQATDPVFDGGAWFNFVLKNDSPLALRDLTPKCDFDKIEDRARHNIVRSLQTSTRIPSVRRLERHEEATIHCGLPPQLGSMTIDTMWISVEVHYRWMWWKFRQQRQFTAVRNREGDFVWMPRQQAN